MSDSTVKQAIVEALEKVEHPAIATTLLDLGMLRDIDVGPDAQVTATLVLPFPTVPNSIRDFLVNSLRSAASAAGGDLATVNLSLMNAQERQVFLAKEQQHWKG